MASLDLVGAGSVLVTVSLMVFFSLLVATSCPLVVSVLGMALLGGVSTVCIFGVEADGKGA